MEEKKLTDEQVLKALQICVDEGSCSDCPYRINNIECCGSIEKDSLAIINSLQAENKRLSDKAIALEVETNNQQAEIERLTKYAEMFERGEIGSPITMDKMLSLEKDKIELQK